MEIGNFKVIDNYRRVKLFAKCFGDSSSRTVSKSKDITRTSPILSYSVVYGILRTYAITLLYKSEKHKARELRKFVTSPKE